ncbi:hypothetical protein FGMODNKE_00007 [Salmonella phage vB_SenS_ER16]|nr:hypothetical protein [Salmonella enterica]QQO87404.1 hypothetical protein IDEPFFIH_00052 [Salmonella phage vB_SenS_ER13]QQO87556.1 hypothetical protein FGMODNKE_00007 [Salmonella phage vB_SenS_ER16]WCZ56938.1 hypothetical protein K53_034 [Salmonella phage Kenya-K53]
MSSIEKAIEEVRLPLLARIKELEEEVLRLRQQRDAANAQLDWLLEQQEVDKERGAK